MFCNKCGKEIFDGVICAECQSANFEDVQNFTNNKIVLEDNDVEQKYILIETPKQHKKRLKKEKKEEKKRFKAEKRAKNKKKRIISVTIFLLIVLLCSFFYKSITNGIGNILLDNKAYHDARTAFEIAENTEMIRETDYQMASSYLRRGGFVLLDSYTMFKDLGDYKDSIQKTEESRKQILEEAYSFIEDRSFSQAKEYLDTISGTEGVDEANKEYKYQKAIWLESDHQYVEAKRIYKEIREYKDVNEILAKPLFAVVGHHYSGAKYLYDRYYVGVYYFGDFCSSLIQLGYSKTDSGNWHYLLEDGKVYFSEPYVEGQERTVTTYKYMFTIEDIKRNEDGEATKIKINGIWHDMAT